MPPSQSIDELSDSLKEIVFRTKNSEKFKRLARDTHFNLEEVEGYTVAEFFNLQNLQFVACMGFALFFH